MLYNISKIFIYAIDCGLFTGMFMFTRSRKGMPHLIYDSNMFRPSGFSNSVGSPRYWECVQNRKTGCRARCQSQNGEIVLKCRAHNHDAPLDFIQQKKNLLQVYFMSL